MNLDADMSSKFARIDRFILSALPVLFQVLFIAILRERSALQDILAINPRSRQYKQHVDVLIEDEKLVELPKQSTSHDSTMNTCAER